MFVKRALFCFAISTAPSTLAKLGEQTNLLKDEAFNDERRDLQSRIVGGNQVAKESIYSFFVSWGGICAGSLIHPEWVLSAAHCGELNNKKVVINAYELDNQTEPIEGTYADVRLVASKHAHPEYDSDTMGNDFLLIKLNQPSTKIPIELNNDSDVPAINQNLRVIGLGTTSYGGAHARFLQEVNVKTIDDDVCNTEYYDGEISKDVMFCAAGPGKDACQGDSGGPIFTLDTQGHYLRQVGIVSFGVGCADANYPGVYGEVSAVKNWIDCTICQHTDSAQDECNRCVSTPTPAPQSCVDTPKDWTDSYGDGCSWYEDNDECTGWFKEGQQEACCFCGGGEKITPPPTNPPPTNPPPTNPPPSNPPPTSPPPTNPPVLPTPSPQTPAPVLPTPAPIQSTPAPVPTPTQAPIQETPAPIPTTPAPVTTTLAPTPLTTCVDNPLNWFDSYGDNCEWYSKHNECDGGWDEGETEACCACGGGQRIGPTTTIRSKHDDSCFDNSEWRDTANDGCSWYEQNTWACGYFNQGEIENCCVCQDFLLR